MRFERRIWDAQRALQHAPLLPAAGRMADRPGGGLCQEALASQSPAKAPLHCPLRSTRGHLQLLHCRTRCLTQQCQAQQQAETPPRRLTAPAAAQPASDGTTH